MTLALWGGVECSIVRIGDTWREQLRETGHYDRPSDLDLIAGLGIRTLRYPGRVGAWPRMRLVVVRRAHGADR